ncbi:hypothetical protein OWV82_013877 [Melia azedarach]|uniref:Uncharacterized protein n=1 Tax=Melia azedarach TaxID=155640 RepID=A0ACC1XZ22_MELAZ|nr:hypothetical protein OWV82_013877 [Melia azedarach]
MDNSYLKGMNSRSGEASQIKQGKRNQELEYETVGRVEPSKEQDRTNLKQGNFDESVGDKWQKGFRQEERNTDGKYVYTNSAEIVNRSSRYLEGQKEGGESKTKKTINSTEPAGSSVLKEKQKDFVKQVSFNKDDNNKFAENSQPRMKNSGIVHTIEQQQKDLTMQERNTETR